MRRPKTDLTAKSVLWVTVLVFFFSCARTPAPKPKALNSHAVEEITKAMVLQEQTVQTIVSSGTVSSGDWDSGAEASALIVGTLTPFRIKVEITHPWGHPLLHILIKESSITILSFSEKKCYVGETGREEALTVLGIPMNPAIIWSFVRAYPVLLPCFHVTGTAQNQITLINDRQESIQIVDFYPGRFHPRSSFFTKANTELLFSDYEGTGSIVYAQKITVNTPREKTRLVFVFDRITVNTPVPEQIFEMEAPAQFQRIPLTEKESTPAERLANAP